MKFVKTTCFFLLLFLFLSVADSLGISSPSFVFKESISFFKKEPIIDEAKSLAKFASTHTEIYSLRLLRFNKADKLHLIGAEARFNPTVFRVSISERFPNLSPHQRRWILLHEVGHAAAFASLRIKPLIPEQFSHLSAFNKGNIQNSLLYEQAYAEAFAEIFAFALSSNLEKNDPYVINETLHANRGTLRSLDITHDNTFAILQASQNKERLQTISGTKLIELIDTLASHATIYQIASWNAHKEAYCTTNRLASWVISNGHMSFTNPFKINLLNEYPDHNNTFINKEFENLNSQIVTPIKRLATLAHEQKNYLKTKNILFKTQDHNPSTAGLLSKTPVNENNSTEMQNSIDEIELNEKSWGHQLAIAERFFNQSWRKITFNILWNTLGRLDSQKFEFCKPWAQLQLNEFE